MLSRLRVPPPRARSICHTFRGPGSSPSYVPGRFEAAAAPSFVPWAMHAERKRQTKKRLNTPPHERDQRSVPPRRSPEASVSPSGSLGTALHTYQVGLKQPLPRRLCPGRYTPRGSKVDKIRANCPISDGRWTTCALQRRPEVSGTPYGALEATMHA